MSPRIKKNFSQVTYLVKIRVLIMASERSKEMKDFSTNQAKEKSA
jgi:hypothetical protein